MNSYEDIINAIDKKQLLKRLCQYYGTSALDDMALMIKRDLKDPDKMRRLIDYVGFDDEDFFAYMGMLFFEIFNKMTIRKIRLNLNVDDLEDETEDDS